VVFLYGAVTRNYEFCYYGLSMTGIFTVGTILQAYSQISTLPLQDGKPRQN